MITRPCSGKAIWSWPHELKPAADAANSAINKLRVQLESIARDGHLNRKSPLPAHVIRDQTIVRVDPRGGVKAFSLGEGDVIWSKDDARRWRSRCR